VTEELERAYTAAVSVAAAAAGELEATRARLVVIPYEYVDGGEQVRARLAKELANLEARERLETALVRELRSREGAALVAIHEKALALAEHEYVTYRDEVWAPARTELENAMRTARLAHNRPAAVPGLQELDREAKRAKHAEIQTAENAARTELQLVIGPKLAELGEAVKRCRQALQDAQDDAAALVHGVY
jgi:hypothetical protein